MPHCQDGISLALSVYCPQHGDRRWEESQPGSSELPQGVRPERDGTRGTLPHFFQQSPRSHTASIPPPPPDTASTKNRGRDSGLGGGGAEFCKNLWGGGYRSGLLWNLPSAESAASLFPELCFHISQCFSPPQLLMVWSPTSSSPATDFIRFLGQQNSFCQQHAWLWWTLRPAAWERDSPMQKLSPLLPWRCVTSIWLCGVARKVTWRMRRQTNENTRTWPSL